MNAPHPFNPSPAAAPPPADPAAGAATAPPSLPVAAALDTQAVEDRLRTLFRLSTRRGLIHPLHHVMLRFRKEGGPASAPAGAQP